MLVWVRLCRVIQQQATAVRWQRDNMECMQGWAVEAYLMQRRAEVQVVGALVACVCSACLGWIPLLLLLLLCLHGNQDRI